MADGSLLQQVRRQVADRQRVDWDAVMARLRAEDATPEEVDAFVQLRLRGEIGAAGTSFQTDEGNDGASTPSVSVPEPMLDDTLQSWGRYTLNEKVGRGGFGSVYRAWDPSLEMSVAIKILHRRFSDERLKERLLQEGRALAQVSHPNVVRVLNVEQHEGRLGLVMEFISGDTVDALVGRYGRLNEREATVIAEDVCRALIAVHNNGLLHRDVKARNIIRERDGRIVLMDFGAGLSLRETPEQGRAAGTPLYMAPETLAGKPPSIASDVYSVGVLLFYLVSSRHPYEGETLDQIRQAHAQGRARSLVGLRPDLPTAFLRVVERALAVDPRERYATPAEMLQALLAVRDVRRYRMRGPVNIAGRIVGGAVLLFALIFLGGLLSSVAFNVTLGRSSFADESFGDWFLMGWRSLVMPVFLSALGAGLVGVFLAMRRVLLLVPVLRRADERVRGLCFDFATWLSIGDPSVLCSWLVVLTGVGLVATWFHWRAMLVALASNVSTAPAEALTVLSPPFDVHRTNYRMVLTLLTAANVTIWYALARAAHASGLRSTYRVLPMEAVVLALLFLSMQLPYRILADRHKFPSVTWHDERCFVIGERPHQELLFCPSAMPRTRIRSRDEGPLARSATGDSLFASFAPAPQ